MVIVKWSGESQVQEVQPADGPGLYTDDVEVSSLRELLNDADSITEEVVASIIMEIYDGELSEVECHVTVGDVGTDGDINSLIAFIEIDDPDEKYSKITCQSCSYSPSEAKEWVFERRLENRWVYHDRICPQCHEVVHTELVEKPVSVDTMDAEMLM